MCFVASGDQAGTGRTLPELLILGGDELVVPPLYFGGRPDLEYQAVDGELAPATVALFALLDGYGVAPDLE